MLVIFSYGVLFQMESPLIRCTQDVSATSLYSGCTYVVASNYSRVVCDASLQFILEYLEKIWDLSVEFDVEMHIVNYFLELCVWFIVKLDMQHLRSMEINVYKRHTRKGMLKTLMVGDLNPNWDHTIIVVYTDFHHITIGRIRGVVTSVQDVLNMGII